MIGRSKIDITSKKAPYVPLNTACPEPKTTMKIKVTARHVSIKSTRITINAFFNLMFFALGDRFASKVILRF